jgi:predicted transcriptional regulator
VAAEQVRHRFTVKKTRYQSVNKLIRDQLESQFWQDVNSKIREAREDVAAGRVFDGESAMNEIIAQLEQGTVRSDPSRKK